MALSIPRALASRATQTSSAMMRAIQATAIKMTPPPHVPQAAHPAAGLPLLLYWAQHAGEQPAAHTAAIHA
jgi:hypothetical protein